MFRMTVQYETPADPEAFDRAYFERHVPLCRTLPGLVGASFSKPRPLGPGPAPYLVAELDFADGEAFRAAMTSPEMATVGQDAETLPAARVMFTGEVSGG
ncbi:EthD family reductase [Nocardioides acrostichi]|uniref:EthD family reductase n=1 Tax=Nocardioides acrostichi TaxID=2784339 RepID=A0A930V0U0_9ACTN|nr:EthD family reductase [Nocardioides acrostichi]MBF4161164.1 EthD family reductase [Nocardioides acrostichi]